MKKRFWITILAACICLMGAAWAEEADLKEMFLSQLQEGELVEFHCLDYDGNGKREAFALVKTADIGTYYVENATTEPDENNYVKVYTAEKQSKLGQFDLWFVTESGVQIARENFVCHQMEVDGKAAPYRLTFLDKSSGYMLQTCYVDGEEFSFDEMHEVLITGDSVNMRSHPNLKSPILDYLKKGERLYFAYEVKTDERGVDWYCVHRAGNIGWVSSVYADLVRIE